MVRAYKTTFCGIFSLDRPIALKLDLNLINKI